MHYMESKLDSFKIALGFVQLGVDKETSWRNDSVLRYIGLLRS